MRLRKAGRGVGVTVLLAEDKGEGRETGGVGEVYRAMAWVPGEYQA